MARRSSKNPPKIDLCKIDTARLRELSVDQLNRVQARSGNTYDLPTKPTKKWTKTHFLFVRFVNAIACMKRPVISARAAQQRLDADFDAGRRRERHKSIAWGYIEHEVQREHPELFAERDSRGHGKGAPLPEAREAYLKARDEMVDRDVAHEHLMRAGCVDDAKRYEDKIRDAQERAHCKLRPEELVARDAEKQGQPERAAEVRRSARRPRTPAKRIITKIR